MKPRIKLSPYGGWQCATDEPIGYIGWSDTPKAAYNHWAYKNRIFPWFIPFYPKEDN